MGDLCRKVDAGGEFLRTLASGVSRDIALLDTMTGAGICLGLQNDAGLRRFVVSTIRGYVAIWCPCRSDSENTTRISLR